MQSHSSDVWHSLKNAAEQAFEHAYAPYSQFHVGAAALTDNGTIVSGCNVENASYGLTQCAERSCICTAVGQGAKSFSAVLIFTHQEKVTPPCGACRQVIAEFCAPDVLVKTVNHKGDEITWSVVDLLPDAFTPDQLK